MLGIDAFCELKKILILSCISLLMLGNLVFIILYYVLWLSVDKKHLLQRDFFLKTCICLLSFVWLLQGSAPTISVDNTGGCQLYLSKDSLGASITTAKSSDINVLVPGAGQDDDLVC